MSIVEIKCAHVEQGARAEEVLDLGDLTDTPRAVFLCPMCWERLRGRIFFDVLRAGLRDGVRDSELFRKLAQKSDG